MPDPINSLKFVHIAIRTESAAVEALATSDGPDLEVLKKRLALIERVMRAHFGGEELGLFPPLAQKFPHIDECFLHDHKEEDSFSTQCMRPWTVLSQEMRHQRKPSCGAARFYVSA